MRVDLNVDAGEGMLWRGGPLERVLFQWVTSVNIACGGHAGDRRSMDLCLALAREHGVAVGAHPSYVDRAGFGRSALELPVNDLSRAIDSQLTDLGARARQQGVPLRHLKPHGALYHQASVDPLLASAVTECVLRFSPSMAVVGPPGSALEEAAVQRGLRFIGEGFPDRAYGEDGRLVPRGSRGALIKDPRIVLERATAMVRDQRVRAISGSWFPLNVQTLCLHGDLPGVAARARRLRQGLEAAGVDVLPFDHE